MRLFLINVCKASLRRKNIEELMIECIRSEDSARSLVISLESSLQKSLEKCEVTLSQGKEDASSSQAEAIVSKCEEALRKFETVALSTYFIPPFLFSLTTNTLDCRKS